MALWVVGGVGSSVKQLPWSGGAGRGGGGFQRGRDRWGGVGDAVMEGFREAESGGLVCILGIGWWV